MASTNPSQPAQSSSPSLTPPLRNVDLQNELWTRFLVGRKYVEDENEGFQDLKCLRRRGLPDEVIRMINSYYCSTRASATLPPGLDTEIFFHDDAGFLEGYRPDWNESALRLTFALDENRIVTRLQFGA